MRREAMTDEVLVVGAGRVGSTSEVCPPVRHRPDATALVRGRHGGGGDKQIDRARVLEVRIHLPPADSPSLSGFPLGSWKRSGFPPVWGGCQRARSAETRRSGNIALRNRQCLCRAIFQYSSVADAVRAGRAAPPSAAAPL